MYRGVIDIVMAYYCTKICPKLPHNLSFTFHNSSEGHEKGFKALAIAAK